MRRVLRVPVLLPAALVIANLFLFGPTTVYAGNAAELGASLPIILLQYLVAAVATFSLLCVLGVIFHRWRGVEAAWVSLVFAVGFLTWLQGTVMVWDYGVFGKSAVDWEAYRWRGVVDIGVWGGVLLAAVVLRGRVVRMAPTASAVLLGVQAVAAMIALASAPHHETSDDIDAVQAAPLWELSSTRNVIHVVLDELQTEVFEYIVASNPETYEQRLDGFTLFTDTLGAYPTTAAGLPAAIGGPVYAPDLTLSEYRSNVRAAHTIPRMLVDAGYRVDIAAPAGGFDSYLDTGATTLYRLPVPYTPLAGDSRERDAAIILLAASFRQMPHPLKKVVYGGGVSRLFPGLSFEWSSIERFEAARHRAHRAFLQDLIDHAKVTTAEPVYKYIHLTTTHWPGVLDQDCQWSTELHPWTWDTIRVQAKCSVDHLLVYLDRLKQLGVYDSAVILLHADHGYWNISESKKNMPLVSEGGGFHAHTEDFARVVAAARPTLAVKPPGAHGRLTRSSVPAAITDTQATIGALIGVETSSGQNVFELPPEQRERRFFYYDTLKTVSDHFAGRIDEYRVLGKTLDRQSWQRVAMHPPPNIDYRTTELDFGTAGVRPYLLSGWSGPEKRGGTTHTWAVGASASILLELPSDRPSLLWARIATLKFDSPQVVTIHANGEVLGSWTMDNGFPGAWVEQEVVVPRQPPGVTVIEFAFAKAVDSPTRRPRAVRFDRLEIREVE